jgi:hypothetical protein
MTKSALFILGGTAPVWFLWLLLFPVSNVVAYKTRTQVCSRKEMPTVVLAKDKRTGRFSVLQRYAPGEQVPPLSEWTGIRKVRDLERSDSGSIPSSRPLTSTTQGQHGGLRSRRHLNDPSHDLEFMEQSSSSTALLHKSDRSDQRFLETNSTNSHGSSNVTLSAIMEDFDLFYAR